jgi:hypothetical protein
MKALPKRGLNLYAFINRHWVRLSQSEEKDIFRTIIDRAYQICVSDRPIVSTWIEFGIRNCTFVFFALSSNGTITVK